MTSITFIRGNKALHYSGFLVCLMLILSMGCSPEHKSDNEKTISRNYSKLVYPEADGKLVYKPDERGNVIPDFSHAGYMVGGVRLPDVPVKVTVEPGKGNDAARIQEAIDRVSEMPLDNEGIRGALLLKKGRYELAEPIRIAASGVVLRGEGQDEDGTVLIGLDTIDNLSYEQLGKTKLIIVEGRRGREEVPGSSSKITDDYVSVGTYSIHVESTEGFRVGDTVIVRRHGNKEWFQELGLEIREGQPTSHDFDRIIMKIENNLITVDAPITCAIETKWGGGEVVKYADPERISQVGIENLRGVSEFNRSILSTSYGNMDITPYTGAEYYSDEEHYWNLIKIDNTVNAWVRNVTALHFAGSCATIGRECKWVTIEDCISLEPVSKCGGGRRYTYMIEGQLCLVQRCFSDKGRHSFILGSSLTCGPNVFLDCIAERPYSSSEPHSSLVVGSLYDNIHAPIAFRFAKSNQVRWMGIYSYAWNCEGMFIVQKPPTAQNYSIGHIGLHAMVFNRNLIDYSWEYGYVESLDEHVEPRSLYLKQLEDRLGTNAVRNIATEQQITSQ